MQPGMQPDHVEALEYGEAHVLGALMLVFSFAALLAVHALGRRTDLVRS